MCSWTFGQRVQSGCKFTVCLPSFALCPFCCQYNKIGQESMKWLPRPMYLKVGMSQQTAAQQQKRFSGCNVAHKCKNPVTTTQTRLQPFQYQLKTKQYAWSFFLFAEKTKKSHMSCVFLLWKKKNECLVAVHRVLGYLSSLVSVYRCTLGSVALYRCTQDVQELELLCSRKGQQVNRILWVFFGADVE